MKRKQPDIRYTSKIMKCSTCIYWDDNMQEIKEHLIDETPTVIHRSGFFGSVCLSTCIKVSSVPLQVADQAVISKETEAEEKKPGLQCINYLFTFGADCLKK